MQLVLRYPLCNLQKICLRVTLYSGFYFQFVKWVQIVTSVNYALTLLYTVHLILSTHINSVHANNLSFKHRYKLIPLSVAIYASFPDYKSYFINIIENLFQHSLATKIYFIFLMINQIMVSHILMLIIMHLSTKNE